MDNEKGLVKQEQAVSPALGTPATGTLARKQMPFEEVIIELDHTGAWSIDGKVAMAFGSGAELIGNAAGVAITKPVKVMVSNEEKDNPHVIYDKLGQPAVMWFRKVGVYIGSEGMIRYVDITDRIDIGAYMAERAVKVKKSDDVPDAAAVFCTRNQCEIWNEKAKEPGQDIWWFVPTQGTEIGVAFNISAKVWKINKLQEEIIHFRKAIFRRFETATNRRVIVSLVPEFMKSKDFTSQYDKQYKKYTIGIAKFKLQKPSPESQFQGLEMGLYQQIARAIREDNAELRDRALQSFGQIYGVPAQIVEVQPDADDPVKITGDYEQSEEEIKEVDGEIVDDTKPVLDPVPVTSKMSEFRAYVTEQLPKMTDEQKAGLREIVGPDGALDGFKGKEIGLKVKDYFVLIAGFVYEDKSEKSGDGEVDSNDRRKLLSEKLAEGDKKLTKIFYSYYGDDWSFEKLSDVEIDNVYNDYMKVEE